MTDPDLENLCRLCLSVLDDVRFNISDENLSSKLIILTSLESLSKNSEQLPKCICKSCRYQLEKSFYLRNVARRADARLRKHLKLLKQNKPSELLKRDFSGDSDDDEEVDWNMLESYNFIASVEDEIQQLRQAFEIEKEQIIKEELEKLKSEEQNQSTAMFTPIPVHEKPFLLNNCLPSTANFSESPRLVRRKKQKPEVEVREIVDECVVGNYEIQIFSQGDEQVEEQQVYDLGQAIEIVEEIHLEPVDSDEDYNPKDDEVKLKKPLRRIGRRNGQKRGRPRVEKKEMKTVGKLNEIAEECYFIGIENPDETDLDENGERKIFQCAFEDCTEKFARRQICKTHYYNHITKAIVTKGFACKTCQKTFKAISALDRHERVHTGEKPFVCDHENCDKKFSQKEMLKRHKITHLAIDNAPFACGICPKKFRQKGPLRLHLAKAHSNDSDANSHKLTCSICQKQFAHHSGLSRHLLIHSGKVFKCQVCEKVFSDKSALRRHEASHNVKIEAE